MYARGRGALTRIPSTRSTPSSTPPSSPPPDAVLDAAQADADAAGLPEIQVTPPQARLLEILCRASAPSQILEFGTLGGYSTIVMARTLPEDGLLTTLEYDPDHAEVAWGNIERAGLADRVDLRVGAALETLPLLESEGAGPFDFVFIDADKVNTPAYFAWALDRTRPGGLIFADNVIRGGGIVDPDDDADAAAQRPSTSTSPKSPASPRRRSRPSAPRATTASPWRSSKSRSSEARAGRRCGHPRPKPSRN